MRISLADIISDMYPPLFCTIVQTIPKKTADMASGLVD